MTDATVRIQRESPGGSRSSSTGGSSAENGAASSRAAAANPPGTPITSRSKTICRISALPGRALVDRAWRYQARQQNPARGWTKVSSSGSSCDAAFPALYPELTPWLLPYCSVTGFLRGENKLHPAASASHSDRFPSHQQHFFPPTRKSSEELNVTKPFIWHFSYKRHKLLATNIVENYHHRYSA